MEQTKTRSVGAPAHRSQPTGGKALMGLMLSLAVVGVMGLTACGQKRPLQLPPPAKTSGTGGSTPMNAPTAAPPTATPAATPAVIPTGTPAEAPAARAQPASAPASAASTPQR